MDLRICQHVEVGIFKKSIYSLSKYPFIILLHCQLISCQHNKDITHNKEIKLEKGFKAKMIAESKENRMLGELNER